MGGAAIELEAGSVAAAHDTLMHINQSRKTRTVEMITIDGKNHEVADDVAHTVALMKREYGAVQVFNSGHAKSPYLAFGFPARGPAIVGIRLNRRDFTLDVRATALNGLRLEVLVPGLRALARFPEDGNSNAALVSGRIPFLQPSARNPVIRVAPSQTQLKSLLDAYLGVQSVPAIMATAPPPSVSPVSALDPDDQRKRRIISEAELLAQLDRNSATGRQGEEAAYLWELQRLVGLDCPDPKAFVQRCFEGDVGCGYDIECTWPGQERCIEVKSTTRLGTDIYVSENERVVLEALGRKAWLYRVLVTPDGSRVVGDPLQDPVRSLTKAGTTPAVWRAPDPSAKTAQEKP